MSGINFEDYLTEDQMREIAIEEWRGMCRKACEGNAERIIANIGHHVARTIVDEALGTGADKMIAEKAVKVIEDLSQFTIFRAPDAWERTASHAYNTLQDAVRNNSELVNKQVKIAIHQLTKRDAIEILKAGKIQINPN